MYVWVTITKMAHVNPLNVRELTQIGLLNFIFAKIHGLPMQGMFLNWLSVPYNTIIV
jgi:hypothetical protein